MFWLYKSMVYAPNITVLENKTEKILFNFKIQMDFPLQTESDSRQQKKSVK